MSVVKLHDFKVAKKFKEDSKEIMKVIDLSLRALTLYKYYTPVKKIINELTDQKSILQAHLNTAEKVLKRGQSNE
jgi:hypothetical protein